MRLLRHAVRSGEYSRADGLINVKIPYYTRIEWLEVSNRRNPSIFMDLLVAHTTMNRYQREKDEEGYYLATEDDFQAAKALFTDKDAEELVKRLTARERDVIDLLITHSEGLTRDEIASKLCPPVATDRVSQIIRGQKGGGGLMQKVQIAETKISDTVRINDDEKRTVHKTVYSLKNYDRFAGFDGVVKLKPAPEEPPKQAKHELSIELSNKTTKHEDDLSKISIEEEEREDTKDTKAYGLDNSLSLKNEKFTYFTKAKELDNELQCLADAKPYLGAKHEHDREQAAKYTGGKKCSKCGKPELEGTVRHNFVSHYENGISSWICTSCSMGQTADIELAKPEPNHQVRWTEEEASS